MLLDMGVGRTAACLALVAMGALKTACIFVAARFLDGVGRRPLLLGSVAGLGLSLAALGAAFSLGSPGLAVAAIWAYMAAFSLGIGPVTWLLAAEVFPLKIRAKAMALATVGNRATAAAIASTFLSCARAVGYAAYFYAFAALAAACWGAIYAAVPETRGRSLEAMAAHFDAVAGGGAALRLDDAADAAVANPVRTRTGRGGDSS